MKKKSVLLDYLSLFIAFFKIGLFTFGGGYAMIPLIEKETIEKKKWIKDAELLDILAISESTPGPIAVNAATFIGYRVAGIMGGIIATLGLTVPSFTIIFLISLIFDKAMNVPVIVAMFIGIRVGVICLLINAILKIKKQIQFDKVGIIIFILALIGLLVIGFFTVTIPCISLAFIGAGLLTGIVVTIICRKEGSK